MMYPAIDNPTSYEIPSVICFLHTKSMSDAEIHCELRAVKMKSKVVGRL
jgi:hypothetical protein